MTIGRIPSVEGGIQPTIFTTKGDILVATANATVTRQGIGSDDQVLVADSTQADGLAWKSVATPYAAGKNKIINGAFDIWQRGTTVNLTASTAAFLADRWACYVDSNAGTVTYSQQTFTPGTAPVAGYEGTYFGRLSTGGNGNFSMFSHKIEDVRTLAGQTVTLSFWAKTSTAKTFTILLRQDFGTGGSSLVDQTTTYTTSTSWQRFTWTLTLGSMSGKTIGTNSNLLLQLGSYSSQTGNFTVDVWGVQLEAGSVATAFQTATGTIQGELAACQRYYQRSTAAQFGFIGGIGTAISTTQVNFQFPNKTTMRTNPTSIDYSNVSITPDNISTALTPSAVVINGYSKDPDSVSIYFTVTGATQYRPYQIYTNTTNGYIGVSAEL